MSETQKPKIALVPPISKDLADYLRAQWPAKCFNPSEQSDLMAARYGGMNAVAEWLLTAHDYQQDKNPLGLDEDAERASKEP